LNDGVGPADLSGEEGAERFWESGIMTELAAAAVEPHQPNERAGSRTKPPLVSGIAGRPTRLTMTLATRRVLGALVFYAIPLAMVVGFFYSDQGLGILGFDFRGTLWEPGREILAGASPYPQPTPELVDIGNPAVYPALPLVLATPLSLLPFPVAAALWAALLICSVVLGLRLLGVRDIRCYPVALMSFPVVSGISFGNATPLLFLGVAAAWRYRHRTWPPVVAVAAIVALKIFLWPLLVWFLVQRRYRSAAVAAGIAIGTTFAAWAAIAFHGLLDYPALLSTLTDIYGSSSSSLYAGGLGLGMSAGAAHLLAIGTGTALLAGAVLAAVCWDRERASFVLFIAAALAFSPVVWSHYFMLALVPIALVQPRLGVLWAAMPVFWLVDDLPRPSYDVPCCAPRDVPKPVWEALHAGPAVWHIAAYSLIFGLLVCAVLLTPKGRYFSLPLRRWNRPRGAITAAGRYALLAPKKSVIVALVLGLPASAILLLLAARGVDAEVVLDNLRRSDPTRLAVGIAAFGAFYLLQAVRWRWIARREGALSTGRFLQIVIGAIACNNVVPGRPGDFLRAHWLGRAAGSSRTRALGTVVVDRAADVLVLLAALGSSLLFVGHDVPWLTRIDLGATVVGVTLVLGLLGARFWVRRRPDRVTTSRVGRLVSGILAGVADTVNRRDAPVVAALSAAAWGVWALGAWSIAAAVGIPLSPLEVIFVMAVVNLGVAIPSSPGFVGTYQWLCVASLGLLGVDGERAFAFSVILHAAWFVPTTIAGAALLAHNGVRRASRPEASMLQPRTT
jgi:uncharacterized protein (TIRG00374 family)